MALARVIGEAGRLPSASPPTHAAFSKRSGAPRPAMPSTHGALRMVLTAMPSNVDLIKAYWLPPTTVLCGTTSDAWLSRFETMP